jgi:hypothetical protein
VLALVDLSANPAHGAVAYWAHVGGFLTGGVLVRLFAQPMRVQQWRDWKRSLLEPHQVTPRQFMSHRPYEHDEHSAVWEPDGEAWPGHRE